MSVKVMSWVFDYSEAEGSDRLVLLALADRADEYGYCWPGIADIARKARVSERTVQRSLTVLEEELHELIIESRAGGSGKTNRYQILCEKGCQSVSLPKRVTTEVERVTTEAEKGDTVVTRIISEPSLEPSPSVSEEQDILLWIEQQCTQATGKGFHTSNGKTKRALREQDSTALRVQILHILKEARPDRNVTSLITGLVSGNQYTAAPRRAPQRFYPERPPDRPQYERPAKPDRRAEAIAAIWAIKLPPPDPPRKRATK